jgi:hypothetical protein
MTLDRAAYFPHEAASITILIKNPTASSLPVIAPFSTGGECFELYRPNPDGSFAPVGADVCDGATEATQTTPATVFAAGEQRQITLKSYDSSFSSGIFPTGTPSVPGDPGTYILGYSYNAAKVQFTVVLPAVDTASSVRIADQPYTDPTTGDTTPVAQYVHVFSLRWNGQSYLCVSQPQNNNTLVSVNPAGGLLVPAVYKRIATSANPIVSITPTADQNGNLTIVWNDSTGMQYTNSYPANGGDTVAPIVLSYRVYFGSQAFELNTSTRNRLPWQVSGIEVVFSKPIANATVNSLTGVTATAVDGLNTNTLLWTINPIALGSVSTSLVAAGSDAITDAAGNALGGGAPYSRSFRVLWGDLNDDGVVNAQDLVLVNNARAAPYSIFADMNGDGVIDINHVQAVRLRIGTTLP